MKRIQSKTSSTLDQAEKQSFKSKNVEFYVERERDFFFNLFVQQDDVNKSLFTWKSIYIYIQRFLNRYLLAFDDCENNLVVEILQTIFNRFNFLLLFFYHKPCELSLPFSIYPNNITITHLI